MWTVEEAWGTNSPEFFLLMVRDRGWPVERFRTWLAETWKRLLLSASTGITQWQSQAATEQETAR